jgi:2-amino-4-hydroxy-6-hydroxymethyldihydropteridine diphosphokinase
LYADNSLIALGANLPSRHGAPQETLEAALAALEARGFTLEARSRWYRTPAFPPGSGPDFVNGAARIGGVDDPARLLAALHEIERTIGRTRRQRWAPRTCDLDLLACGDRVLPDRETVARWIALAPETQAATAPEHLILPHPRLQERGFVLRPLADVAPDWVHPVLGRDVRAMLAALPPAALAGIEEM